MAAVPRKPKEQASDEITSLRQQVETLKQDVSIWKASSKKWAQRHAEVHAQVETLTQELQALKEDARWRNHWHKRLGRGIAEPEGQLYKRLASLTEALRVIHVASRDDAKSECWTIRKWLDDRGVFNDDIGSVRRLVEAVCVFALPSLAVSSREPENETKDDTRQSSPSPVRTTGSPREPTKGSER